MKRKPYRDDLTDEEWKRIEPILKESTYKERVPGQSILEERCLTPFSVC